MSVAKQHLARSGAAALLGLVIVLLASAGNAFATGIAPVLAKTEASEIKRTSIKVCAELNPEGEETTYQIGYRKLVFGETENNTTPQSAGSGEAPLQECVQVTGLETNATYQLTFKAKNATGENQEQIRGEVARTVAVEGVETLPTTNITAESAILSGTLEPNGYDTHYYFECLREKHEGGNELIFVPAKHGADAGSVAEAKHLEVAFVGLSGNTEYTCGLVAENALGGTSGGRVSFDTPKAPPIVDEIPLEARDVAASSVAIAGGVTAQNEPTRYWIEYVSEAGYDAKAGNPYANGAKGPVGEIEATSLPNSAVLVGLSGLSAATTYHYRLVAENGTGASYGPDDMVTTAASTPPLVLTGNAAAISATAATISGTVNPQGLKTSYEVQLGETASYGGAEIFGDAGEGETAEAITVTLQYLTPATTYHYRVLAVNEDGTSYGADQTFTTPAVASPIVQAPNAPLIAFTSLVFPSEKEAPAPKKKTKPKVKPKKKKKHKAKARKKKK